MTSEVVVVTAATAKLVVGVGRSPTCNTHTKKMKDVRFKLCSDVVFAWDVGDLSSFILCVCVYTRKARHGRSDTRGISQKTLLLWRLTRKSRDARGSWKSKTSQSFRDEECHSTAHWQHVNLVCLCRKRESNSHQLLSLLKTFCVSPCTGGRRGLFSGRAGLLESKRKLLKNSTSCLTAATLSPCLFRMCLRTNSGAWKNNIKCYHGNRSFSTGSTQASHRNMDSPWTSSRSEDTTTYLY